MCTSLFIYLLRNVLKVRFGGGRRSVSAGAVLVSLCCCVGGASADILKTRHNFLAKTDVPRDSAKEVCVFCHAPALVEGDFQAGGEVVVTKPQWQTGISQTHFSMFDDFGRGGIPQNGGAGSVSIACLSCHDGSQAWAVNREAMSDHPFGVPYRGFRMDKALAQFERQRRIELATVFREALLSLSSAEFREVKTAMSNKRRFWWTGLESAGGVKTKNDITLTPRILAVGEQQFEVPYVECSSCHDPHAEKPLFLRIDNSGSRVCYSCHIK